MFYILGFQTLGEEYCNIVQIDSSKTRIPSNLVRKRGRKHCERLLESFSGKEGKKVKVFLKIPYLFAYKPIPAISRDPKLERTDDGLKLVKKIGKLSAISRDQSFAEKFHL